MPFPTNQAHTYTQLPAVFEQVWIPDGSGSFARVTVGGDPSSVSWEDIQDKPASFPPAIGITATTAKAGNYQPTWEQVTSKPASFPPAQHSATLVDVAAGTDGITAANLQVTLQALASRIAVLEATP